MEGGRAGILRGSLTSNQRGRPYGACNAAPDEPGGVAVPPDLRPDTGAGAAPVPTKQDADAGAGSGSAAPCALAHISGTTGCASSLSAIARQPQARLVGLLHQHAWYYFSAAGRGDTAARCRVAFGGLRRRRSAVNGDPARQSGWPELPPGRGPISRASCSA